MELSGLCITFSALTNSGSRCRDQYLIACTTWDVCITSSRAVGVSMVVKYTPNYPDELPNICFVDSVNLTEEAIIDLTQLVYVSCEIVERSCRESCSYQHDPTAAPTGPRP